MADWWNKQTRIAQDYVPKGVRVQISYPLPNAGVAERQYAMALKAIVRKESRVRIPPPVFAVISLNKGVIFLYYIGRDTI